MKKEVEQVTEFHRAYNVPYRHGPSGSTEEPVSATEIEMRASLIMEEAGEVAEALYGDDVAHTAKELADLMYVTAGTAAQANAVPDANEEVAAIVAMITEEAGALVSYLREMAECRASNLPTDYDQYELAARSALVRIEVLVLGIAAKYNIPFDKVFDEVHRSNMSKIWDDGKVHYRDDGKVLKGPNYTPPDIMTIINDE